MKKRVVSLVFTAAGLLVLAGCLGRTAPARFYALASMEQTSAAMGAKTGASGIAVGIGPIKLADYLNRADIVTRETGNTLRFAEFEQWAGSLEDNLTLALAENLGLLLHSEQVFVRPWPQPITVDYRITLEVIRFDGQLGGEANLIALWSISGEDPEEPLAVKRSSIQEPTGGNGYEDLGAAESRALARLSREIAQAIITKEKDAHR